MNETIEELRSRFDELELSEKRALSLLGGFLILVFVYFALWAPANDFVASSKLDHERHLGLLNYLQSTEDDARSVASSGSKNKEGASLITAVSRTARSVGVSPSRMQPEGDGAVSVWFEAVPFTQLMRWLERLDTDQGIAVRQISMDRQDAPGQVSARIVLRE